MSTTDYHRLLWQVIDKNTAGGDHSSFVMTLGKLLNPEDYKPDNENAGYNTSLLVDNTMMCTVNYTDAGSHYSLLWDNLLKNGKGPPAGEEEQKKIDDAKKLLYKVYPTEISEYYKKWMTVSSRYLNELLNLEDEMKEKYGDYWETHYDERKKLLPSYPDYNLMQDTAEAAIDSINVDKHGIYYLQMKPLIEGLINIYISIPNKLSLSTVVLNSRD